MDKSSGFPRTFGWGKPRLVVAALLAIAIAGCTSSAATSSPGASGTAPASTAPAGATLAPTPTPTATAAPTLAPTPTPTATQVPTPTAAATPTHAPTPLPPLAVGLCRGSQLKLVITLWEGSTGTSYAHVTATNKSSSSCNMRGTSEARIADGHGNIIGDAGASAARVVSSDPIYALVPGGSINTIVQWGNWCKSAPAQQVFVAMVQPFGLGGFVSKPLGNGPIPTCYASASKTQVSSEAWLP